MRRPEVAWARSRFAQSSIEGLTQLFDDMTHRPKVTRAKGIINLATMVQTIALTAAVTALGPLGFATGMGVSFILSLDETVRQMRRWHSAEYFLVDSLAELDKVELLIKKKQKEIEELKLSLPNPEKRNKLEKTAYALKKSTLETLLKTREKLKEQIEVKVDINRYENQQPGQISSLYEIITRYHKVNIRTFECQAYMEKLQNKAVLSEETYKTTKAKDLAIQADCKKATQYATSNSVLWALAFTGMLLTCVPGGQIPGIAIVAAVSVIYLLKNSKKIVDKGRKAQGFFKKLDEQHEEEGEGMPSEAKIAPPPSHG